MYEKFLTHTVAWHTLAKLSKLDPVTAVQIADQLQWV